MKVAIPKEIVAGETRVAVIPSAIGALTKEGHEVYIESGAGERASFSDEAYRDAGAEVFDDVAALYNKADVILKIQPPAEHPQLNKHESELLGEGKTLVGFLAPFDHLDTVRRLAGNKVTAFAMELVPRITRAQSMDALSSQATIAGYKAVLMAANHLGKLMPLLMTAAGTITPANVFILGAGVAGLQAIATANRLGARVEAFDPRTAVKEQVESLGAQFVQMELPKEDVETKGGYAKAQTDEFLRKEQEAIASRLAKVDVVITTAQIFGQKAPVLITEEMLGKMRPGSVIVDLAAAQGGNCALTEAGKTVEKNGVTIIGAVDLPAQIPVHASQMYSKNITNLFRHIAGKEGYNFEDEITKESCLTHGGEIRNEMIADAVNKGGQK